jgi:hypothetical protein
MVRSLFGFGVGAFFFGFGVGSLFGYGVCHLREKRSGATLQRGTPLLENLQDWLKE